MIFVIIALYRYYRYYRSKSFFEGTTFCYRIGEFKSLSKPSIRHKLEKIKINCHLGNTLLNWANLRQSQFIMKTSPQHRKPGRVITPLPVCSRDDGKRLKSSVSA